jgi:Domain of unknown function (DUF3416).
MIFVDNDRWRGVCTLYDQAIHEYTVEAWTDTFRSWQQEFAKKFEGGISDLRSEALEGAAIVKGARAVRVTERTPRVCANLPSKSSPVRIQKFTPSRSQVNWTSNGNLPGSRMPRNTSRFPTSWSIAQWHCSARGMNFSRARQRATGIADRPFRDCLPRVDDAKQWGSTSFIFRRFIRSVGLIARVGITRSLANQAIRECHGRSAARPADTKRWNLR